MTNKAPHSYYAFKAQVPIPYGYITVGLGINEDYVIGKASSESEVTLGENNWGINDVVQFEFFVSLENNANNYFSEGDLTSVDIIIPNQEGSLTQLPIIISNHGGKECTISQSVLVYQNIFTLTSDGWQTEIAHQKALISGLLAKFEFKTVKLDYIELIAKGTYLGTLVDDKLVYNP